MSDKQPPHPEARKLVLRYTRGATGSLDHSLKYAGKRDDMVLMGVTPLAFEMDLSSMPEYKRHQYLVFEQAYGKFYDLWTGSGLLESKDVSRAMDAVQMAVERLRSVLTARIVEPVAGETGDDVP